MLEVQSVIAPRESHPGRQALTQIPLAANKRLSTTCVLKEAFGQLWDYGREGWARHFFDNWRASLKWQRLGPHERFADMIATGTASPPTANQKTKSQLASSKTSTTKYASSSDAATGCATTNISASRFSPACCRRYAPQNHPLDSLITKFIDFYY